MTTERRYWDSDVFLSWLQGDKARFQDCASVIRAAEKGEVQIVTSALTLAEVIKMKSKEPVKREHSEKIRRFFRHEYIAIIGVNRFIAEHARELIWEKGLMPKDAIHVATALKRQLRIFDTFDTELHKLDGKLGAPPLRIAKPWRGQMLELPFPGKRGQQKQGTPPPKTEEASGNGEKSK